MGSYSCSLVKSFVGEHVPIDPRSETVTTALNSFNKVVLTAGRPPSMLKDHKNFIGYDGVVEKIQFSIFSFICPSLGIIGREIIEEMAGRSVRQATGYENALLVKTKGFQDLIKKRSDQKISQTMAFSVNDFWKNHNGYWTGCVDVKDGDLIFRHFFAGEKDPFKHRFPIGGEEYLIVGVNIT